MAVSDKYTSGHTTAGMLTAREVGAPVCFSLPAAAPWSEADLIAPTVPMGHSSVIPARSIRTWVSSLHAECD